MLSRSRPVIVVGLVFLGVFSVVGISEWRAAHRQEIIPWRADFTAAVAEAKSNHKDVFAYFTAEWCGPCRAMKHDAWADETVRRAMLRRYVPVRIDVDANPDLARQFDVDGFPTFIVLSDDGSIVRRTSGGRDADDMRAWLEK